ncbi:MAG: CDP-alcohol phosphatidyltransferase family protein [Microthrixaceae bacterium]
MTAHRSDGGPVGFSQALDELNRRQKTSKGAPAYSLLINRPLGRRFAAVAYVLGRTPNQVTALSATFTLAAIVLIATVDPTVASSLLVSVLLVVGYALDAADGQLARLRGGGSAAGEWLDHLVDAAKVVMLHAAVLINWFRFGDSPEWILLIPLAYMIVASVLFFIIILNDQIRRAHRNTTAMILAGDGSSSRLYSLAVIPTDYGLMCLVFSVMFWRDGFRVIYAILMLANAGFLSLGLVKWFREVSRY